MAKQALWLMFLSVSTWAQWDPQSSRGEGSWQNIAPASSHWKASDGMDALDETAEVEEVWIEVASVHVKGETTVLIIPDITVDGLDLGSLYTWNLDGQVYTLEHQEQGWYLLGGESIQRVIPQTQKSKLK